MHLEIARCLRERDAEALEQLQAAKDGWLISADEAEAIDELINAAIEVIED